ncbi:MAG: response regulator transcription factor [Dehalococcoidales bacterium]|nr:response regulator transcription factor [Dehalococcoidales bacterium]
MLELGQAAGPKKSQPKIIKILIADDHPLIRQALRVVLEKQPEFKLVGEASDGEETIELTRAFLPHVVIMDISMPKLSGLEATRQIKAEFPDTGVLVLTVHNDNEHVLSIIQAGADGYLTKSVFGNEVIHAVRAIAAGATVLSPAISQQIFKYAFQFIHRSVSLSEGKNLTSRELEILKLTARGISNKDIAYRLNLSLRSIKRHQGDIFLKLGVQSRTEAVAFVLRTGILSIEDLQ